MLKGKTIAVCVTGGIAAYKACELVSLLTKRGADVHVVLTESARHFVSALTFETLSKNRVIFDMFDENREWEVEHISLAKKASAFVIAPCTANVVGKLANGIADDFLTTTVMAATCPVIIAPAMNTAMYNSAAFVKNCETLTKRGVIFINAEEGLLACGDVGSGRLASVDKIEKAVISAVLPKQDLLGKRIIITAGATIQPIDSVRFISNKSSGKMGLSLAAAAARRGAQVVVIAGKLSVTPEKIYELKHVETTLEMHEAVLSEFDNALNLYGAKSRGEECIFIMAAAPCDYNAQVFKGKIKSENLQLNLSKSPDIAAAVGKRIFENKLNSKLVIFCAETENLIDNAKKKLIKKQAHMAVANDVTKEGAGFDVDTNIATIITSDSQFDTGLLSKKALAELILDKISTKIGV